jgi:hypothetical protein
MDEGPKGETGGPAEGGLDVRGIIHDAIEEYARKERARAEPAYKGELAEERKRREQLEHRVNELVQENERSRQMAEEAERGATVRAELQKLGVAKVDLAFKAVKDDIRRTEDGRLMGTGEQGTLGLREYLTRFVNDNPEFLPARNLGGSGVTASQKTAPATASVDLDKIKPGMSQEEMERVRQEIARIASQAMGG